jgi:hypothetical protein
MDFLRQKKKGQLSPKLNKSLWKTRQAIIFQWHATDLGVAFFAGNRKRIDELE